MVRIVNQAMFYYKKKNKENKENNMSYRKTMVYPGSRIKLAFASEVVSKYHNRSYTFQCVLQVAIGALEMVIYRQKCPGPTLSH